MNGDVRPSPAARWVLALLESGVLTPDRAVRVLAAANTAGA